MDTSAVFRQNNEILYSANILKAAEVNKQLSAKESVSSGPTDVLDLNHDGKIPSHLEAGPGSSQILKLDEPSIVSPKLDKLQEFAKQNGAEVVTQADLPEGVFVSDRAVSTADPSKPLDTPVKPLNMLVNDLPDKFDPNARFALDFATGQLLVYKPAVGGVVKDMVKTDSGLQYGIMTPGHGEPVKPGQQVAVQYTGWLENGKKFDSSLDHGTGHPFVFQVGAHNVISGWDEGVAGMKVGEKRKLVIPPDLGYGARGAGDDIPPNSTLIFNVELLAYRDPPPPPAPEPPAPAPAATPTPNPAPTAS